MFLWSENTEKRSPVDRRVWLTAAAALTVGMAVVHLLTQSPHIRLLEPVEAQHRLAPPLPQEAPADDPYRAMAETGNGR